MSAYLSIDGGEPDFLASTHGYGDLCRWIDGLDVGTYPELVHLREHGWCQSVPALAKEIEAALRDHHPGDEDTATVAADLLETAEGCEVDAVLVMNDGVT